MLSLLKKREPSDRSRLNAAFEARDQAQQAVNEQRETVARLQSVIDRADEAARAASEATRAANDARKKWVRDGCLQNAREHHALAEAAAESARVAQSAGADADAVRGELRRAQEEIESRQVEVRGAEEEITAAVAMLAAEENAQLLAELVQDAERFLSTREKVMGLRLALYRPWALSTKNSMDPSHEALELIDTALDRAAIKSWERHVDDRRDPKGFLDAIAAPWRALAAKLRGDCNS